ncbi:THAP domain-containing protein 5 isoform X2 [Rhineura floridana]|uniref:THAP domain-containing protein 5 isoform X2 n=1 Tax=Rhineura floridana TaxID=261503 RepID=UPI002AC892E0|nr:THAP domain-containing protein 5 isoform X2 [Rhineura floridana]
MPRYCAATCCKNRAGQNARDQRKLSFYPFPLHDKERLEKWLRNMKRDTWTPSKHQVLCSDHFTPDSLDVRWGIRYLKTTAVPTIFSSTANQEKGFSQKKKEKIDDVKQKDTSEATTSLKLCSPKKNIIIEESLYRKAICTTLSKSSENKGLLENTVKAEDDIAYPNNYVRQNMEQMSPVLVPADVQNSAVSNTNSPENFSFNNSVDNLFSSATTILQTSVHDLHSCLERLSDTKATVLQTTHLEHLDSSLEFNNITVPINDLPSDQLDPRTAGCSVEVQETDENSMLLHTVSQALEQFNGNKESVITIIVPSESSRGPMLLEGSFISAEQELVNIETEKSVCITSYSGIEVLQTEHLYCRRDSDREQLWQKITKLHSKIALLEVQERKTLTRLKSLEALIAKLKQENLLSEEKLKIVENCFTTFEVTMIQ